MVERVGLVVREGAVELEVERDDIDVQPSEKKADGTPYYALPVIYDPNTKTAVTDSAQIAKYLDTTYPDTPVLFPPGSDAFQAAFHDFIWTQVGFPLFKSIVADVANSLPPRSAEFFRATRERTYGSDFGKRLEDLATPEEWGRIEAGLTTLRGYLEKNGEGNDLLLMGSQVGITHSDIQVAGMFVWAKIVWGEDSEKYKKLTGLHGGKWAAFVSQFSKFEHVDL